MEVSLYQFNYFVGVTAGDKRVPEVHVAKFYGRLRLIRSVLRIKKIGV